MYTLHVSVVSVNQSALAWCLSNLSSMGTGGQESVEDSPPQDGQLRHSKGTEFDLLACEGITHRPVASLFIPPDPS